MHVLVPPVAAYLPTIVPPFDSGNLSVRRFRLKKLISRGAYEKEDMMNKLDVFLMANRITEEQYQELVGMME